MRNRNQDMKLRLVNLAVQGALAAMFAAPMAAAAADTLEDEVAAIRRPTNYVEIGAMNVSRDSAKFGEYSGLNNSGGELIGNFSLRGGDAYQGGDGTKRWEFKGNDLGTTSRELGAAIEDQGKWRIRFGYDELRHNITDTYQTPQQGSMGGNVFTLPSNFGVYSGGTNATTLTTPPSTRAIPATALHTEEVSSTRKNTSFGADLVLTQRLSLAFDYNRLSQSGAKLMGSATLGNVSTGSGGNVWKAEMVGIIMNPTNYKTDTVNLGLKWVGDNGYLSGGYFGSYFSDDYDRVSWQNSVVNANGGAAPAGVFQTTTMSTAPDNKLHQLNVSGGYAFSSATKLAGGLSYGRNTQNEAFLTGMPEINLAPASSLNGKVITQHIDFKLSHQATRNLGLTAAYKFDKRDNKTPSNVYRYLALNNTTVDYAANAPYSNKKSSLELAGDYRFNQRHAIRLAYNHEKVDRKCNDYALSANCLIATSNTEDKIDAKYRFKASDSVNVTAGYGYAKRKGSFEFNAVTPLAGLDTATPNDVNSQNYPGFVALPFADRKRDMLKAGINWQATKALDLSAEARYAKDKYDPALGVQDVKTTGLNLDATYSYSEDATVSAYASWQASKRNMRIGFTGTTTGATPTGAVGQVGDNTATSYAGLIAPNSIWTNALDEDGQTFGINTKHKLMGGKLELVGDVSYSLDKSRYSTRVPFTLLSGVACSAPTSLTCGDLPDIKTDVFTLKVTGIYDLDKRSKVSLGFIHQKLKSEDYFYNWYQLGYTGLRGMPTNQQAPNHSVNVIAASYIYSFK